MANLADLLVHVGVDAEDLRSGMDSAVSAVENNIGKITAAGAAAGAMAEGFARSQGTMNSVLARTAAVGGDTTDSLRDMVDGMVSWNFSAEDATVGMERLMQSGISTRDEMEAILPTMDNLMDATGVDMVQAIDLMDGALTALGVPLTEAEDNVDAFTYLLTQTNIEASAFERVMQKVGPTAKDMGLNLDDVVSIMGALDDKGIRGREAISVFDEAMNKAGDSDELYQLLGLTNEELAAAEGELASAAGMTNTFAEANNNAATPIQKLQANVENLMFKYGGLGEAAGMLAMPLMALGPVMKGVAGIWKIASGEKVAAMGRTVAATVKSTGTMIAAGARWAAATAAAAARSAGAFVAATGRMVASGAVWVAQTVAQGARAVASMAVTTGQFIAHYARLAAASMVNAVKMAASWVVALGPVGWVIAGVVALVALIIANWDKVKEWTGKIWDWVGAKVASAWTWVKNTTSSAIAAVVGFVGNLRDRAMAIITAIVGFVREYHPIMILWRLAKEWVPKVLSVITGIRDSIKNFFSGAGSWLVNAGKNIIGGLISGIKSMVGKVGDAITGVVSNIRNKLPFSPAKEGPLSGRGAPDIAGAKIGQMLADGLRSQVSTVSSAGDALARNALPGVGTPRVSAFTPGHGGSEELHLLRRIAGALEDGGTDWEKVGRTIGRETAREQQMRQRVA